MKILKTKNLACWVFGTVVVVSSTFESLNARESEQLPNILWIMLDDLRADALHCYGTPWARTHTIDAIARRGILFKNATTQNVVCSPSRHSMMTGQYCHTLRHMAMGAPPTDPPTYLRYDETVPQIDFPTVLASLGMRPFNVGKAHWGDWWESLPYEEPPRADFARFDPPEFRVYPLVKLTAPQKYPPRNAYGPRVWTIGGGNPYPFKDTGPGAITATSLAKLAELIEDGKPFFLRVSYNAPHIPILVPPRFMVAPDQVNLPYPTPEELAAKSRFEHMQLAQYSSVLHLDQKELQSARGSYYGLVSFVDFQIGKIVKFLEDRGQLDNTLIIITSDQGLQLGEHGLHKKRNFYEQTVTVPLIFSWPGGLPQGKVIDELVELIDLFPTVMDLVGFDIPEGIAGRSLMPLIRGEVTSWRPLVFSEIDHSQSVYTALRVQSGRRVMVRSKQWKLIYFRDERVSHEDGTLYDLIADPGEKTNLFADPEYVDVVESLQQSVDKWDSGVRFEPQLHNNGGN